jgi:hypothetical protein
MIVLHPKHELFVQFEHPACPVCRAEILPGTPVVIQVEGEKYFVLHEKCAGIVDPA